MQEPVVPGQHTPIERSVGAGFVYPMCGEIQTMPGLAANPVAVRIDVDYKDDMVGLR
jgi:formate--tetrahydrofolate ligase